MSDEPIIGQEEGKEKSTPLPFLNIQMMQDGSVCVDGPLGAKGLCYSMLEQARDVVMAYAAAQRSEKIIKANGHGNLSNFIRRFNR